MTADEEAELLSTAEDLDQQQSPEFLPEVFIQFQELFPIVFIYYTRPLTDYPFPKVWPRIPIIEGAWHQCMTMFVSVIHKTLERGLPCFVLSDNKLPVIRSLFEDFLAERGGKGCLAVDVNLKVTDRRAAVLREVVVIHYGSCLHEEERGEE